VYAGKLCHDDDDGGVVDGLEDAIDYFQQL